MKLAVIGAGYMAAVIVKRAREMGVETHCFAWEKGAVAKEYCDYFYPVSVLDKDEILTICQEKMVDGIIAGTEIAVQSVAFVAEKMGLPGNSVKMTDDIRDKYLQRQLTGKVQGLQQIQYCPLVEVMEKKDWDYAYPCILKPVDGAGKEGIVVVNNKKELFAAASEIKDEAERYIVEEYIEGGREFSVESLSYKGDAYVFQITDKVSSGVPLNVELAHHQPADISDDLYRKIEDTVIRILSSVGLENGASHTEIKVKNDKIYLIEINGRLGGDHIAYPLTELSTGLPYISCVIDAALGRFNPDIMKNKKNRYASVFFVVEQTKYLKDIFDKCQNEPWCYEKVKKTDDLILLEKNDGYRINYFIYYSEKERPVFLMR